MLIETRLREPRVLCTMQVQIVSVSTAMGFVVLIRLTITHKRSVFFLTIVNKHSFIR